MITKRVSDIDGRPWPPGPWDEEPDRLQWKDETTGLDCLVRRGGFGAWCGYVAVGKSHPLYAQAGDVEEPADADLLPIKVHGGITYAAFCDGDPIDGICHVSPDDGDKAFWLGFDCGHYGDAAPEHALRDINWGGEYKTLEYVKAECGRLAAQLAAMDKAAEGRRGKD